jgi:hypothetical protein
VVTLPIATAQAYTMPYISTSLYAYDVTYSNWITRGQTEGSKHGGGTVILQFGRPARVSGVNGFLDYNGHFDSMSSVLNAAEAYATGYHNMDTTHSVNITIGSSNNNMTGNSNDPTDLTGWGSQWGSNVNLFQSYINAGTPYTNETAWGSFDAEPNYDVNYTDTYNVLNAYHSQTSALDAIDGSLDGGPAAGASAWTAAQQYQVTYGFSNSVAFPQLYYANWVQQWANLDQWAHANGHGYYFTGMTTGSGNISAQTA